MKTLEESAVIDYQNDRKQPEKYQIPDNCFIDWYKKGAKEAQRWVSIDEEMPEETGWLKAPYLAKTKKECHVVGFTQGHFHHFGGLCLKPNYVTHWRLIERS